jgi:hypothetical protein
MSLTNEQLRRIWGPAFDTCHLRICEPEAPAGNAHISKGSAKELAAQRARRLRERGIKKYDKGDDHEEICHLTGNYTHE